MTAIKLDTFNDDIATECSELSLSKADQDAFNSSIHELNNEYKQIGMYLFKDKICWIGKKDYVQPPKKN